MADELVFGKLLEAETYAGQVVRYRLPKQRAKIVSPSEFKRGALARNFRAMFSTIWHPVTAAYARKIIGEALAADAPDAREHAKKPKRLVCLGAGTECVGAIALLPKRGGAVKALLLRNTDHGGSLELLVLEAIAVAKELTQRKIYYLHPVDDSTVIRLLRRLGFSSEGLLRAPYVAGQDVIVMAKFL